MQRSNFRNSAIFKLIFVLGLGPHFPLNALCIGVGCTCSISSDGLNFASYDPLSSSSLLIDTKISVSCTATAINAQVGYTVSFSIGLSNNYSLRAMSNNQSTLNYNIFLDKGRTQIAGDGTGGTSTISDKYLIAQILSPYIIDYPIYGTIYASQKVSVGDYNDQIVVSVTF